MIVAPAPREDDLWPPHSKGNSPRLAQSLERPSRRGLVSASASATRFLREIAESLRKRLGESHMSRDDDAERGRAEPIDVEYEPAYREEHRAGGASAGGHSAGACHVAAGVGAAGGAVAPRVPAVQALLNNVAPATTARGLDDARQSPPNSISASMRSKRMMNAPLADAAALWWRTEGTAARVFALQSRPARCRSTADANAVDAEVSSARGRSAPLARRAAGGGARSALGGNSRARVLRRRRRIGSGALVGPIPASARRTRDAAAERRERGRA
jgi:hypothetical protein